MTGHPDRSGVAVGRTAWPLYPTPLYPLAALPAAVCIECTIATADGLPDGPARQDWSIGCTNSTRSRPI